MLKCFRCGDEFSEASDRVCPSCGETALVTHTEACDILNDMHSRGMLHFDGEEEEELMFELTEDFSWQE